MDKNENGRISRMKVVISGTPGSGKTTAAAELSKLTGWPVLNVSGFLKNSRLIAGVSRQTGALIADECAAREALLGEISAHKNLIIDTHMPELIPQEAVDIIVILHVPAHVLLKRLKGRGWAQKKIDENIMAELASLDDLLSGPQHGTKEIHIFVEEGEDACTLARKIKKIIDEQKRE